VIYVPDTNALSAYLRGDSKELIGRMQSEFLRLRLSVVVVAEREFGFVHGAAAAKQRPRFEALLELIPVEPLTLEDAMLYAKIRSGLEKKGQGIGPMDTLIAAQAVRLGATLVTRNLREFSRVPGLKVENWQG
jgi:tRNA(fMet)-specific endonuclease VapC